MTLLIFIIILGVLVLVHELGHFLVAKWAGVQVEEFGFGYPPRAISIGRKWGTLFSINWIPFGGFVKIFGENYEEPPSQDQKSMDISLLKNSSSSSQSDSLGISDSRDSGFRFTQVSRKWQAAILVAGVTFNIIFAWFLFSLGFLIGLPAPVENSFGSEVSSPSLTVVALLPDSPAQKVGLKTGDKILKVALSNGNFIQDLEPENVANFVKESNGDLSVDVDRAGKILNFVVTPEIAVEGKNKMLGIQMDMVGTLKLPLHRAFIEGGRATLNITYLTVGGILNLIKDAVLGKGDLSSVTGPVGIVGLVGDASRLGFSYLLTFTALISINLAVVNLIPFPALDGGRLLFVAVESVTKRPINPKFAGIANTVGFFLLISLMLIVTYRDVVKLF